MTKRKVAEISGPTNAENGSDGSRAEVILNSAQVEKNTGEKNSHEKKRIYASKRWGFTWFGSNGSEISDFRRRVEDLGVMCQFQEEICPKTNREHIQGFVVFREKQRPIEKFKDITNQIHWFKLRGSIEENLNYTGKERTRKPNGMSYSFGLPRMVEKVSWDMLSTENQQWLKPIMDEPYDYRTIHWICDYEGNWGKSRIQKYLVDNFNAIMVSGSGKDIAFAISKYHEDKARWPDYVLCNIPRSTDEKYISYGMLEQVKDGLVFSGKYESCQLRLPQVKMIVFANTKPIQDGWSIDRVKLTVIGEQSFVF